MELKCCLQQCFISKLLVLQNKQKIVYESPFSIVKHGNVYELWNHHFLQELPFQNHQLYAVRLCHKGHWAFWCAYAVFMMCICSVYAWNYCMGPPTWKLPIWLWNQHYGTHFCEPTMGSYDADYTGGCYAHVVIWPVCCRPFWIYHVQTPIQLKVWNHFSYIIYSILRS